MKKNTRVIQFRGDEDIYQRAQERITSKDVLFPDVMRAALKAVADGDVTPFADIINEAGHTGDETNQAWLYHKCHELFEYRDGKLLRKSRKGMGEQGTEVYIRIREGEEHVIIHGTHYPLKDIIWLMSNGSIAGEVIYKNPYRVTNKHSIDNLIINPVEIREVTLTTYLNGSEKIDICRGKQRAILINTDGDINATGAIERLINRGQTIPLLLRGDDGWLASRTAIHAFKLTDNQYILSIS
ncbi:hypothetical protein ATHEMM101B_10065 [Atlantibacter hermannii]|uniref:hypothetical protein n=1 Tax=Atlantibacter hermannii TaxID=565 RepID=UPI003B25F193